MTVTHIKPAQTETFSFEWGSMKWFVSPVTIPGAANSQGEVIINPGQGHVRHLHEHADELIYVISGTGIQTVGDEEFPIAEGDAVYIPMATLHSTMNTGWRTLRLIVTYAPGGEEQALTALPDFTRHPAGEVVGWRRSGGHLGLSDARALPCKNRCEWITGDMQELCGENCRDSLRFF